MPPPQKRKRGSAAGEKGVCLHDSVWKRMCLNCGQIVESQGEASDEPLVKQAIGGGISVTTKGSAAAEEAHRRISRLRERKKLALVLDLDHTLIHTINSENARAFAGRHGFAVGDAADQSSAASDEDPRGGIFAFRMDGSRHEHVVKLRPGCREFLRKADANFELSVYTHGIREYANWIAGILDPTGKLFAGRIVSRSDTADLGNTKSLERLFPSGLDATLVLDDNERVYIKDRQLSNLILCKPYRFWPHDLGGDVNVLPLPAALRPADEAKAVGAEKPAPEPESGGADNNGEAKSAAAPQDADDQLLHTWTLLKEVHHRIYGGGRTDGFPSAPRVLDSVRAEVLRGVVLVLSGIKSSHEKAALTRGAVMLGAMVIEGIDSGRHEDISRQYEEHDVTHVLAANGETAKVKATRVKRSVWLLHVDWLAYSMWNVRKEREESFLLTGEVPVQRPALDRSRNGGLRDLVKARQAEERNRKILENKAALLRGVLLDSDTDDSGGEEDA